MSNQIRFYNKSNMLFFILIFLLLFYDSRPIGINRYVKEKNRQFPIILYARLSRVILLLIFTFCHIYLTYSYYIIKIISKEVSL